MTHARADGAPQGTGPGKKAVQQKCSTVPALLARAVELHGDRPAAVEGDLRVSYAELAVQVRSFAAALVASGVARGDAVAIWAPNGLRWIVAALGAFEAGAVVVPVNTRFKGREAADVLLRSGAKALVTVTDFLGGDTVAMLRAAEIALPRLETVVVSSGAVPYGASSYEAFVARADSASQAEAVCRAAALGPDDPSDVLFTSGTTGVPKGVVQTHGRTVLVATDWVAMTGLTAGDRYLMVNPYFHMFGLKAGILACVSAGATMLPQPVFDVDVVLARTAAERVTVLPGPPTLYQSILDHPRRDAYDLSSLRVAVTGAAEIPVELIERVLAELPFPTVVTGYGLTEAGTAAGTSLGDDARTIATTVGRPRPGFELRIVDEEQQDVPQGEAGEVLLRGGSVMSHYLDDPDATREALSEDGWLRTGDIGRLDDAGCLQIVGRSKDMFIVGGFNAYPAEIEGRVLSHPDVQQVAVIGVPDPRLGEVAKAFVVLAPGSRTTAEELVAWCRAEMANYKAPRSVELLDALPLTATGKVVKDELRRRAAAPP